MTPRSRRILSLPVFVALTLMVVTAAVPRAVAAQPAPGTAPGIVATGFGRASVPASTATLQFVIGRSDIGYAGMPGEMIVESGPMASPAAEGMPPMPEMPGMPGMPGMPAGVTEADLEPIVRALVDAGVPEDALTVTVPSASQIVYGPGGPAAGEIVADIAAPQQAQLAEVAQAARAAASDAGLALFHTGVHYQADDCVALLQQAREAAVADARSRAEGLAQATGATLGELVQASEYPYFGPEGADSCGPAGMETMFGPYGPGTYPVFNPSAPAEASATTQVTLTYALGEGQATPAP